MSSSTMSTVYFFIVTGQGSTLSTLHPEFAEAGGVVLAYDNSETYWINDILFGDLFSASNTVVKVDWCIGDSLSAAQPAIALSGIDSYGSDHGISKVSLPFVSSKLYDLMVISKTKNTMRTDPLHDYTAPQNFKRDYPAAAHVVWMIR
ncbi:uncharacterized protein F5147DRAFT_761896 [Suillus discolor]|uniref:Uncharacterized protein n=1 Tax=Suillus discolor TaxID=1912936 RepID=A0A9P7JS76_9AGAM|nr:uncharacterized protein F5147DRAFT_761896 [Suillus discolor]KAG2105449.1 hypothetical protein F5147DRAFT_761896 [Suillus discolor]